MTGDIRRDIRRGDILRQLAVTFWWNGRYRKLVLWTWRARRDRGFLR